MSPGRASRVIPASSAAQGRSGKIKVVPASIVGARFTWQPSFHASAALYPALRCGELPSPARDCQCDNYSQRLLTWLGWWDSGKAGRLLCQATALVPPAPRSELTEAELTAIVDALYG